MPRRINDFDPRNPAGRRSPRTQPTPQEIALDPNSTITSHGSPKLRAALDPASNRDLLRDDEAFIAEYLNGRPESTIDPKMVTPDPSPDWLATVDQWLDRALDSVEMRSYRSPLRKLALTWLHTLFQDLHVDSNGDSHGIVLAGSELAAAIGCSQATAAAVLRDLTFAGLLRRGNRRRCVPYTYWLRIPKPRTGIQLMLPSFREDELRELRQYLRRLRVVRTHHVFVHRTGRPGLPICTATTLTAVDLGARSVTDIAARTGATVTTIRRHLAILADHGLVAYTPGLDQVDPTWEGHILTALRQLARELKKA